MANKLMTAKDVVASIKDGMTIGIGGWGPRRKPMALVRELLRSKEEVFQRLGLGEPGVTDAQLLDAVAQHPVLLNRPIVVTPRGARLCRPPEQVLALISG